MANTLAAWGLYSMLGVSAATGVGVATGVIPIDPIEAAFNSLFEPQTTAIAKVPDVADPKQEIAKLVPKQEPKSEAKAEPAMEPAFDVLRVEKDGSVVVAGRAPANSKVELIQPDGKVLGTTDSGPSGDFVIVLDSPLKPGDHTLALRSEKTDEEAVVSSEVATVHIPSSEGGEVLALVTKEGEASRIVIKPKQVEQPKVAESAKPTKPVDNAVAEVADKPKEPIVVAALEPEKPVKKDFSEVTTPSVEPKVIVETKPEPVTEAKTDVPPSAAETVVVEAVEVENGTVFIAGAAKPGAVVRLYIDNKPVGTSRGTPDGRFLLQKKFKLTPGRHTVRADLINKSDGKTMARAEVPLVHEPIVAQTSEPAPAQKTEPKPVEVVAEAKVEEPVASEKVAISEAESPDTQKMYVEQAAPKDEQQAAIVKPEKHNDQEDTAVIRTGSTIIIKPGDNLWRISRKTYGHGIRYTTIYNANRDQIRDPSRIYIGQIFKIPKSVVQ